MNPPPQAALFDMDKTLVRVNTARLFTRYRRDLGEANLLDTLQVGWWLLQYSVGVIDADHVARKALSTYRDTLESDMVELCNNWFPRYVLPEVTDAARQAVETHRKQGAELAIVTSSTLYSTAPLARELSIPHIITSELEVKEGRFTGEIVEPLCYGTGKIERAHHFLAERNISFQDAVFYSDSITDLPLLEKVGHPVVINPDLRLKREAKKRGWPVQIW